MERGKWKKRKPNKGRTQKKEWKADDRRQTTEQEAGSGKQGYSPGAVVT